MNVTREFIDLSNRLERTEKTLRSILEGKKPDLDPAGPEGWIFEQLALMHEGFFIPEVPKSYVTLPGEGAAERELKGDMRFHPLSYKLVLRQKSLEQRLHKEDIRNFKVLGIDYASRDTSRDPAEQLNLADNIILPRADLYSLWQFSSILKDRLDGKGCDKPLIVQSNAQGFWNPMIGGLGLDTLSDEGRKMLGLHLAAGPHETLEIMREKGVNNEQEPRSEAALNIKPGSVVLVVTRNSKKVHELQSILDTQKANVRVLPFCNILPKPMEAKETSKSYAGNNMEKVVKAWERLDQMGPENVDAALKARGIDPEKTYLWFDDRGLDIQENFMAHPLFDECRSYLNPYKPMPGAEMAHVNKSMSLEDFYTRLEKAASDLATQRRAAGQPDDVDLTDTDRTNYMICPLLPDKNGHRPVYNFLAGTSDRLVFSPRPATDIYKYSEHFQVPKNIPGGRTKAEIEGYIESMSSMALAAKAAMYTLGMEDHADLAPRMRVEFNGAAAAGRWKIGTQHSLRPESTGHGKSSRGLINQLEDDFRFMSCDDGVYDPTEHKIHEIYNGEDAPHKRISALNNFYRFAIDANAFLLTSERKKSDVKNLFAKRLFTFFSLVVGKQVFDPVISSKPFIVLNKESEGSWDDCLHIFDHLHKNGFIGDKPHHVFKLCKDRNGAVKTLNTHMKRYIPDNVPQSSFWEKGSKAPDHLFRVTIYCSATSTNDRLRKGARDMAYGLAQQGCAVQNGGGMDGLMVETSMGVHDFREWWQKNGKGPMPENHISSIQCEDTYQSEGLCDFNDYVCVQPNIFFRMDDLQDADAEIVLAGGSGTVQELIASVMQREAGLTRSENRPLIIVNSEIGEGRHRTRVYDPLIAAMPNEYFSKYNIHVVGTVDEALALVKKTQALSGKYIPSPMPAQVPPAPFTPSP